MWSSFIKLYNKDTIEYSSWFLYACTCIESTFFFMLALEKHSWCCKIYSTISTSKWYRYSFRHWMVVLLINHWQFSLYRIELQSLSIEIKIIQLRVISITIVHHYSKNYNVLKNLIFHWWYQINFVHTFTLQTGDLWNVTLVLEYEVLTFLKA